MALGMKKCCYMTPTVVFASTDCWHQITPQHCAYPYFTTQAKTVDQCTVQLSGTNCATTHSQWHTANFGFPSVGEIHFKHWQHLG